MRCPAEAFTPSEQGLVSKVHNIDQAVVLQTQEVSEASRGEVGEATDHPDADEQVVVEHMVVLLVAPARRVGQTAEDPVELLYRSVHLVDLVPQQVGFEDEAGGIAVCNMVSEEVNSVEDVAHP